MGLPMGGRGELGSEQPSATVAPFSSWRDVGITWEGGHQAGDSEGGRVTLEPLRQAFTRSSLSGPPCSALREACARDTRPLVSSCSACGQHFLLAMPPPHIPSLTCHHACDGRRGVAALPAGGDVGWISGQRGPHHLSSWKDTTRNHWLGPCTSSPSPLP